MKRHRAFTLVEILIALSLIAAFSVVAYRLLGANFQLQTATAQANNQSAALAGAVASLRADLSVTRSFETPAPGVVRLRTQDPSSIDWTTTDRQLFRSHAGSAAAWDVGRTLSFQVDGVVILLAETGNPGHPMAFALDPRRPE